jgi:hypothetical protein
MHPLTHSYYDRDAETNLAIDHIVGHLHEPLRLRDLALALEAIMILPQPTTFSAHLKGSADGFDDACHPGRSRAGAASEGRIACGLAGDLPFPTEKRIA